MTVLRQFGPPLQWPVETLNPGIAAKAIAQPWYDFLVETDFDHGDEVSFYYRPFDKVWEIVIRRQKDWDDSDTH